MKKMCLLIFIIFTVTILAQSNAVKINVVTTAGTTITLYADSISLEGFIKRYIDRHSSTSTHTMAEIDAAVDRASSAITVSGLSASGLYVTTSSGSVPRTRQLYSKDLIINGTTAIKTLTVEIP